MKLATRAKASLKDGSRSELMTVLGLSNRKSFRERYLQAALQVRLIEMTIPDRPNSRLQKYRPV